MPEPAEHDAASFARRHAGELDKHLTSEQRDLLGRVVARRIERGAKIEAIAQAVSRALPDLGEERALRLGRDEALRALAWERLSALRASGAQQVALAPAADACPACRAAAGVYPIAAAPAIPIAGCAHADGCRCLYRAPDEASEASEASAPPAREPSPPGAPTRPWYRPRPPRPHGPRWSDEQRAQSGRKPRRPPP